MTADTALPGEGPPTLVSAQRGEVSQELSKHLEDWALQETPSFCLQPFSWQVPCPGPLAPSVRGCGGGVCAHTRLPRGLKGMVEGGGPGSARGPRQVALPGRLVSSGPSQGPQDPDALLVTGASEVWQIWTTGRRDHGKLPWRAEGQGCGWSSLRGRGLWDLPRARHTSIQPGQSPARLAQSCG